MVRNMGAPSYAATFTAPVLAAIVVAGDRTVRLWSVTDHSCIKVFEGHASSVLRVRFVRAGMQLVTAGADGLVKLWSVKDNLVRIYPCSSVTACHRVASPRRVYSTVCQHLRQPH